MADGEEKLIWRKSRFCAAAACIEVATDADLHLVRDSANPNGARIAFGAADWASFIAAVRRDDLAQ